MMHMTNISKVYFVGIGGIGMSGLARYFKLLGKEVFGYDKTHTSLTQQLEAEGMEITYTDALDQVPDQFNPSESHLVVFTPAIPEENQILSHFKSSGFAVMKRAEVLGLVTRDTTCLAVAGTHGKTTTSAILGHLLAACDMPVTAFLGGVAENYQSNFLSKGTAISVVEADEFDRSFLHLSPDIACITSMDADHLDIYGDASALEASFEAFASLLPHPEKLFVKKGLPLKGQTVAIEDAADFEAQRVRIEDGSYVFDLKTPQGLLKELRFNLPGHHNLLNAITALGMAISAGTPTPGLPKALSSFRGVQRRFSYKIKTPQQVLIDDYAHHPTELNALYQAVSEMYPEDEKVIAFQPHLFSRTRDFGAGFAQSLAQFDEVLLLDIYPAREKPIPGITSDWLLKQISNEKSRLVTKQELGPAMAASSSRIKLLVGAGDIGAEVENVTQYLKDAS